MRRRKKNTLLPKMIGIAIVVNAILLPIMAQFGVFKGIHGRRIEDVRLVTLPPEKKPPTPKRTPPKKRIAKTRPHPVGHVPTRVASAHPERPNPNQPKVVASAGGSGSGGPVIDNSGTAAAGRVPTPPVPAVTVAASAPPPATPPPPVAPPTPPVAPPLAPPVTPQSAPPPHVPVIAEAEPLSEPQPHVPDDLSYDDIHGDFQALFTIEASGSVSVQKVSSTGNSRLDDLALEAARHWTFRPATVDGKPVDSFRRLAVQFYPT